jgi:hypothetical protein
VPTTRATAGTLRETVESVHRSAKKENGPPARTPKSVPKRLVTAKTTIVTVVLMTARLWSLVVKPTRFAKKELVKSPQSALQTHRQIVTPATKPTV